MNVPPTQPYFSDEDINYILDKFKDILEGNSFLSTSTYTSEFETQFAAYIGTKFGVGCNSGTSALELICRALNLEGKEVILPSNTFIATANAILNAGGVPVFADCGDDMCMDAEDAISRVTANTAVMIHVHIGGLVSPEILKLREYCRKHNIHLIEDAAQAHGSSLAGTHAGAFGIAAGFSFFSTKVMTTGEGGMVTTNDSALAACMKSLREFGKVKKDIYINHHTAIGYNWRMPEVAALLGIRQLGSLTNFMQRRQEIARIYNEELADHPDITIVRPSDHDTHNYFKYITILPRHDRMSVHKALQARDVHPSGYVYEIPLHKQPVFPWAHGLSLPKTEFLSAQHLCLPIFFSMTNEQVRYSATMFKEVLADTATQKTAHSG